MVYESKSLEDTAQIAKQFLTTLAPGNRAIVVAFYGDLGAGKTTFIQALAKEIRIEEPITSPTFVIQKTYSAKKYFDTLVHIDAYRLSGGEELSKLRFEETISVPDSLVCVEWSENVLDVLPLDIKSVICTFVDETTHTYEF